MTKGGSARALDRLACGRAYVETRAVFYSQLLHEMSYVLVDDPEVTMGITKGLVLYVGETWLLTEPEVQTDEAVGACLVHECEHIMRGFERFEALPNRYYAGLSADEPINENLLDEGWRLPSWVVTPAKFGHPPGLTMEQYYNLHLQQQLETRDQKTEKPKKKPQQKTGGQGQSSAGTDSRNDATDGNEQPRIGAGGCGGAGGNAVNQQLEAELDAQHGKSESEVESARQEVFDTIEQIAEQGRGSLPGRFKDLIATRRQKPDIDWRKKLGDVLRDSIETIAGDNDYSMSHPSIGGLCADTICSGLVDRPVRVVVVEDTSASMGTSQLQNARNEIFHLMHRVGLDEVVLIQADTEIQFEKTVRLRQVPHLPSYGRGGTDFCAVFDRVSKKYKDTNLLIYFTDGDGRAPKQPPRHYQVVWCLVRTPRARIPAPWGRVVVCDKNQKIV